MHRPSLRLQSCCQTRLCRCFHNIHSRRDSSVPVANTDKQAIESLTLWQDSSGKALVRKALARKEEDTKNIFVDDLSATLEAHRASNRAGVIRKLKSKEPVGNLAAPVLRPLLAKSSCEGSKITETHTVKESGSHQIGRADPVQAQGRCGTIGSRGRVRKTDPSEYTGVTQWPKQPWEINHSSDDVSLQRPWLAYMETTNERSLQRFVQKSHRGCL